MVKKKKQTSDRPLPSKEEILTFMQDAQGKVGKREIARAFHIKGGQRIALKRILKEMSEDGLIEGNRKKMRQPGTLQKVTIVKIVGQDGEGDYFANPVQWNVHKEGPLPVILIGEGKEHRGSPPGVGDRVLAHIDKVDKEQIGYGFVARPIKVLPRDKQRLLGVFQSVDDPTGRTGGEIQPIDKKQLKNWFVHPNDCNGATTGELVAFEITSRGRSSIPRANVTERLGNPEDQGLISLIAIETHGIPNHFPEFVLTELSHLPEVTLEKREDLRDTPFVTIDPADARDHDDAVWATRDTSPDNEGGYVVIVAIADVSYYVRPGTALDEEAQRRGNSVYFPDRVVPMLPELISNDLCSLREGEERPALAVKLIFDKGGQKQSHEFSRILMKSAAKLSYDQAQAGIEGRADEKTAPFVEPLLKPLWEAYAVVQKARKNRAPLELDLPERKILMDENGGIKDIITPDRFDAHKLIEEFMIQANVAAAQTLEQKKTPLIYRVHDQPSDEKIQGLKDFLATLDLSFGGSGPLKAKLFNGILSQAKGKEWEDMVTEMVLRSQSQAEYRPDNLGHFGLNLARYAHFTSPIRRYADLIVHRGLVRALGFGEGGLVDDEIDQLDELSQQISDFERRAMVAERETVDRLIASFLSSKVGSDFKGRIAGVTRAGLFVKLDDTGADGFIPISTLANDYYIHDEEHQALVGERTGERFHLGQRVDVRLVEIVPTAGAIRFEMISNGVAGSDKVSRAPRSRIRKPSRHKSSSFKGKRGGSSKSTREVSNFKNSDSEQKSGTSGSKKRAKTSSTSKKDAKRKGGRVLSKRKPKEG